jgi:ABC-2 type transport system permease protein
MSETGAPAGAIYDRGYRHYQGVREGRSRMVKALMLAGVRRTLGLRRTWKAKVVPWGLLLIALAPVVAFVGIRVAAGDAVQELIGYAQYLRIVSLVLLLFAATAGPELLCPDRQSNVLALYFTRPLSRSDYLLAKGAALLLVMGLIAVVPMVVLLVGNVLTADGAMSYLGDHLGDVPRILVAGGVLTVYYSVISMAIASLTERRSIAVAVQLGVFLGPGPWPASSASPRASRGGAGCRCWRSSSSPTGSSTGCSGSPSGRGRWRRGPGSPGRRTWSPSAW